MAYFNNRKGNGDGSPSHEITLAGYLVKSKKSGSFFGVKEDECNGFRPIFKHGSLPAFRLPTQVLLCWMFDESPRFGGVIFLGNLVSLALIYIKEIDFLLNFLVRNLGVI